MSFVSYAQNFEDVMLWRALKHIQNGVYVDVGAQHPVIDSVSKAFYEHGWRGVHIEPVPYYARLLRRDRPDEVVLEIALSDSEGTLELNVIAKTGLSTAVDAYAQRHHTEQGFDSQRIQVQVLTLKSALPFLEGKDVHWLKIDVEGLEEKVLKGWDSLALRPWVIVVEATIPLSTAANFAGWEPILTAANYQFVYFDGLNRFYVAKEHIELAEAFSCPPNVFDRVRLSGHASSELCRGLIEQQKKEIELATAKAQQMHDQLIAIHQSRSWYITKPLRAVTRLLGGDFLLIRQVTQAAKLLAKKTLRPPLAILIKYFFDHKKIRASLSPWIKRMPWLHQRLLKAEAYITVVQHLVRNFVKSPQPNHRHEVELPNLTPRARHIYFDLKAAVDRRNKEDG